MLRSTRWMLCAVLGLLLGGCGGEQMSTAPVTCQVTLDGKPLTQGPVLCTPAQGRQAQGSIQADGTAVLGTYDDADGAVLGTHRIAVVAKVPDPSRPADGRLTAMKWLIPRTFGSPDTSGLKFEIVNPDGHELQIALSSSGEGHVSE